jgi:2-hydroxycyclohexanecarboxyl-CoA dehydrogenase
METLNQSVLNLEGKVAIVTGAGQGVGEAISQLLAAHGAKVVVNDFFPDRAKRVADEILARGGSAIPVQADVTDATSVAEMVRQASAHYGPIDILVNNAGNFGANPSEEVTQPFWEHGRDVWGGVVDVNLFGVINCVSACIPSMIEKQGGRIITIISDAARVGQAGLEIYSAAKAGSAGFMRAISHTLGRYQVTANTVSISATSTPALEERFAKDPDRKKKVLERYIIRRLGQPADVANMVLFLASDASSWITGQTYPVNGGYTLSV